MNPTWHSTLLITATIAIPAALAFIVTMKVLGIWP